VQEISVLAEGKGMRISFEYHANTPMDTAESSYYYYPVKLFYLLPCLNIFNCVIPVIPVRDTLVGIGRFKSSESAGYTGLSALK